MHRRLRLLGLLPLPLVLAATACGSTPPASRAAGGTATTRGAAAAGTASPVTGALAAPQGRSSASAGTARPARPAAPVRRPVLERRIDPGQTGWFASPSLVDLDGDRKLEIVAPMYSTYVFSGRGRRLATGTASAGRVYAPSVVADLDGDGTKEIVVGGTGSVVAYEWRAGRLVVKPGWPASVTSGGQTPEVRGLAAADLLGDGRIEVVATTTNTSPTGSQVFVLDARGRLFQPRGGHAPAWPRYNQLRGAGNDKDAGGQGNSGYGAYGLNVGIGRLEDGRQQDIVVTFDNHQINVFRPDGTSVLASRWYTNPANQFLGRRLGWGQFIRWLDPKVEDAHLHAHGAWPSVTRTPWLQWTASPPSIADLDNDGRNEVIGVPNVEKNEPYQTQAHALMVLDGAQGGGGRSARRHPGFTTLPLTGKPVARGPGDWYPPDGVPAPTPVDLTRDGTKDIVFPGNDGYVYAVSRPARGCGGTGTRRAGRGRSPPRSSPPTSTGTASPSSCSASTACGPPAVAWSSSPPRADWSATSDCRTRRRTATAPASPRRRPSGTSTATAGSRSSPCRSTTASTSSPCPAAGPGRLRGRRAAAGSCDRARRAPRPGDREGSPRSTTARTLGVAERSRRP
ncbi:MAG TPA: FG-GAP-like repeat-containing protein [Kineosporiaceae bacterium]|nr:FG-GAP-like repeat-containing protein [Kineosporiaceae bacterium]